MKRIRNLSMGILLVFGCAIGLTAQNVPPSRTSTAVLSTTVCPGAGCVVLQAAGWGTTSVQVTGTWVGTLSFEGSLDGVNYVALSAQPSSSSTSVTTTAANGVWTVTTAGYGQVRVRFSAFTSGTAAVSLIAVTAKAGPAGGGGGGGGGGVTNIATTSPITGGPITTTGTIACPTCADAGGVLTFTNKRITKRVVTAADATSITPNTDNADITYQLNAQAAGTLTINADAGTPTTGQSWTLKIKSTNAQTFAFNALYVGGTSALPIATTGGGKIDYFAFIYDTVNVKWDFTGVAAGF
jgi:hypothetical protein